MNSICLINNHYSINMKGKIIMKNDQKPIEFTKFELKIVQKYFRIRSTGEIPVVYALDENGQVFEVGTNVPITDLIKENKGIYLTIEKVYNELKQVSLDKNPFDCRDFFGIYGETKKDKDATQYFPLSFNRWLKIAFGGIRWDYFPENDIILKEDVPYISNSKDTCSYFYFDKNTSAGDCPLWNHFRIRFQNPQEWEFFKAWIWTIFDASIKNRQMLYLLDKKGNTGKSTLVNAICTFMGRAASCVSATTLMSSFPLENVAGKRFITYPEVKLTKISNIEVIKNITGGDFVSIARKNKPTISEKVFAKILMTSNYPPEINPSDSAALSRIVVLKWRTNDELAKDPHAKEVLREFVEFDGDKPRVIEEIGFFYKEKFSADPEGALLNEMPAFLNECRIAYEKSVHTQNIISVPESARQSIKEDYLSPEIEMLDHFFDEYCDIDQGFTIKRTDLLSYISTLHKNMNHPSNIQEISKQFDGYMETFVKNNPQLEKTRKGGAVWYRGVEVFKEAIQNYGRKTPVSGTQNTGGSPDSSIKSEVRELIKQVSGTPQNPSDFDEEGPF